MTNQFLMLERFENVLWEYLGIPILLILGIILLIQSRFFPIRKFPRIMSNFWNFCIQREEDNGGIHPLKAFFASIGGCVGIGNIVGVCTAVQIGGPGALFWIWITAIIGAVVKYSEVFLGIRYRTHDGKGNYRGGPMYFLQKVTKHRWIPILFAISLCVYSVEIYQFTVITESLSANFAVSKFVVGLALLVLILIAVNGGIRRVGNIASIIIPVFVVLYVGTCGWVLWQHSSTIPTLCREVLYSAFFPSSAWGGLIGGTIMVTLSQGVRRGCYSGDIGIGYSSIVHSTSVERSPEKQASLVVVGIFLDTFIICTMSILVILATGIWNQPLTPEVLVQTALSLCIPSIRYFIPLFLTIVGFSTIVTYFYVGLTCARFISPKYGKALFSVYAITAFMSCTFSPDSHGKFWWFVVVNK